MNSLTKQSKISHFFLSPFLSSPKEMVREETPLRVEKVNKSPTPHRRFSRQQRRIGRETDIRIQRDPRDPKKGATVQKVLLRATLTPHIERNYYAKTILEIIKLQNEEVRA